MELSKFENGIIVHNKTIRQAIKHDDLYVMHEDGYSYTVGMREINAPELVMYGHRKTISEEMFKIIHVAAAREIGEPDIEVIVKSVFEPSPRAVALSKCEKMELFFAARTFYDDWTFDAVKIILDKEMDVN